MKNELPKTKIDERTGSEYRLEGDYYIPNLTLPKQEAIILNKYRVEQIINKLKAESDLTEEMKDTDILYWVGTMNAIKNQAEEIVFNELIYV